MTWSGFIAKDLRSRIAQGDSVPSPLTLHALAKHYNVSITPVQSAVNALVREGVIKKTPGGRLTVAGDAAGKVKGKGPLTAPEPPKDFYKIISEDLVTQSLQGKAHFLRETQTAQAYGVSGTRLRQIFSRLAGEGLIEHVPRQGWRLRPFRQEDMDAFVRVREAMELLALEMARPKLEKGLLADMLEGNTQVGETVRVDDRLHGYFQDLAGNAYIKDFFVRHGSYFRVITDWEAQNPEANREAAAEHRGILEALIADDWELARKRLSYHIRENYPILKKMKVFKSER
jgi:DNA-binding GntR family transcriptional regulator